MNSKKFNVLVFTQTHKTRYFVGTLWREKKTFYFQYDISYIRQNNAIPLGPDLPLTPTLIQSKTLFATLKDRIPSKENPAYKDYCHQWNISPEESDELILLTTIGHRGPSSFIFRREPIEKFNGPQLKAFRENLGLSIRDFALFIESLPNTIYRTETGELKSQLLLNLCEILAHSKEALLYQLDKRGKYLHDTKITQIKQKALQNKTEDILT